VRVVGEAGAGGDEEVVEHEEGGEVAELGDTDGATNAGAGAFGGFTGREGQADEAREELGGCLGGHVGRG